MSNTPCKLRFAFCDLRFSLIRAYYLFVLLYLFPSGVFCQIKIKDTLSCVEIRFDVSDKTFPSSWQNKKINPQAEPLAKYEVGNVINCLEETFTKYPETILCKYLKRVFVFKSMHFYNVPYGGTFYKSTVYITDDNENLNCSYDLLENYFHHEFSSILLDKNTCFLKKKKWKKLNPAGFHYGKGGLQAIVTGSAEMSFDPELNERGFLTRYSEASLEEDFNVYCQNIFNGGPSFWKLVDKVPKIKAKTDLVIRFYQLIDKSFTEEYFRK